MNTIFIKSHKILGKIFPKSSDKKKNLNSVTYLFSREIGPHKYIFYGQNQFKKLSVKLILYQIFTAKTQYFAHMINCTKINFDIAPNISQHKQK